jgi:exosome complex RNA-binding protein Rrp42 (RNase PH superfamily)
VELHLPPLCHPKYTSIQAQQEEGKALETFVQSVLLRCGVVRREDLCIAEGRHVWKLNVDIQCLSHEGSLGDACILAAVSALADVRLPATAVDKDEEVIILPGKARVAFFYFLAYFEASVLIIRVFPFYLCCPLCHFLAVLTLPLSFSIPSLLHLDNPSRPLEIPRFPVPLTIGLHSDKFLCDLSLMEEERMRTRMTVVLDAESGQLCSVQKAGGTSMTSEQLASALPLCNARRKQVTLARSQQQPKPL